MVPFTRLNYSFLDDNDRLAIITHTTETFSIYGIENDSSIAKLHTVFSSMGEKLNLAMHKASTSPLTDIINSHHKNRVKHIGDIQVGIHFFLTHEDDQKMGAAKAIQESFNRYLKRLPDKKKITYTNAITNFLADMKEASRQSSLEILDMGEKIVLLEEAQNQVVATMRQRAEIEKLDTTPLLQEIRTDIHKMLDVLEHLLYFNQYLDTPNFEVLTLKLNSRISEIMAIARSKHTQELNGELEDELLTQEAEDGEQESQL